MALSSNINQVDPRPTVRRLSFSLNGLSTTGGNYVANQQLGTIITISNASRLSGGYGTITTASIVDLSNVLGATDLHIFSGSVGSAGDKMTLNFSDTDMGQYYIGTISFPAPTPFMNNRAVSLPAIGLTYQCDGTSLYGVMSTLSGHATFNTSSDVKVSLTTYQY
ncbi:hypothetical protein KC968_00880 [Candidatus Saccharibacteria bacterium]|nr:hypothetical protein [Candidatus Saccharibacteria bacterium]